MLSSALKKVPTKSHRLTLFLHSYITQSERSRKARLTNGTGCDGLVQYTSTVAETFLV